MEIDGAYYGIQPFRRNFRDEEWYDPPVFCDCTKCSSCALNGYKGHCVFELKMGEDITCEDCRSGRCL